MSELIAQAFTNTYVAAIPVAANELYYFYVLNALIIVLQYVLDGACYWPILYNVLFFKFELGLCTAHPQHTHTCSD